ncbi:hypothetical protein KSX_79300 [Ktedonospora formicarum]|uniref:Transposase IS701-like DDE domain-containing protein n=2 Tax=Ktedonospora formicarum TaxID=2778364 RepID=A0A8J3MUV9_9CHLR|nr:hypothetical protein KSX_79300 [Ktedonospora formicarum]
MIQKKQAKNVFCQESAMPHPIVCLDARFRQYLERWQTLFSRPQFQHFVTVLLALIVGSQGFTLLHFKRAVAGSKSLASLSRFFAQAPWDQTPLHALAWSRFVAQMQPWVHQDLSHQRTLQPVGRGRPRKLFVIGYLIGDDSTIGKPKGVKMQGLGRHHDSKQNQRVKGHSLVQGLYVLLGQHFPLEPRLYRQQATCVQEGVSFQSKIALMIEIIKQFEPPQNTFTHVLLGSWYSAKAIWKAARDRGFLITTALRSNRSVRIPDATSPQGWRWQRLCAYDESLPDAAFVPYAWPRNPEHRVWVHVLNSSVKSLYRCQLIIIRQHLDDPVSRTRFWASSDLQADVEQLLTHISCRWDIEVFFEDVKELLGIDHYQLMSAQGLQRYWSLCWIAFSFLEEHRGSLQTQRQRHVTLGEAKRDLQHIHHCLLVAWITDHARQGATSEHIADLLAV